MDVQRLRDPDVQERFRHALGEILIKEGMTQKQLCDDSQMSTFLMNSFLTKHGRYKNGLGLNAMIRIAHYLSNRGCDIKELINPSATHQG